VCPASRPARASRLLLPLIILVATFAPSAVSAADPGRTSLRQTAAGQATPNEAAAGQPVAPGGPLDRSLAAPPLLGSPAAEPAAQAPAAGGFLLGANYEGPADQAWQMWQDDRFDPALIAEDFARARAANLSVLRIFVQKSLADDVRANRWTKLDRVLDLADRHGLRLIVTFADYTEWDLAKLAQIDTAVATRYKGRPTILAFDLKNEPRFGDLGLSTYPDGPPPLQQAALVQAVRQSLPPVSTPTPTATPAPTAAPTRASAPVPAASPIPAASPTPEARARTAWLPREEIAAYRASEDGQQTVPARLDDEQAYVYANVLRAYLRLLDDAGAWARTRDGGTSIRYLQSDDSAAWQPFVAALNDTLAAYLAPRLAAIRRADPDRLVTIAQVDPLLAIMPTNGWLDYRTFHRYPGAPTSGSIKAALALWDDVQAAVPDRPLVLGEFGFANDTVDEATSAALEAELVRAIRERGGAGALKWMLNDFPSGANPRENSFGMYRGDGTPKPVVDEFRALGALGLVDGATALDALRPAGSTTWRLDPACEEKGIAATPAASPARPPSPAGWAVIAGTSGLGAYLRGTPRVADALTAWPEGTRLELLGRESDGDGLRWKEVRDPCGQVGWLPARYAAPSSAP
jgi:hypothetical protein